MTDFPTVGVRLIARDADGTTRQLSSWSCPVGGVPLQGDLVAVDDRSRRILDRLWRGPYLVLLILSDPTDLPEEPTP